MVRLNGITSPFVASQNCKKMEIDCAQKEIARKIAAMLLNGIVNECGSEGFEVWCEGGNIFESPENKKEYAERCQRLMSEVAPYVNKVTEVLMNFNA